MIELLQIKKMQAADQYAIDQGVSGQFLMQCAGQHVANKLEAISQGPCHVHILAGPGNNGGDAFVAARLLKQRGYKISLDLIGKENQLSGDAKAMAQAWRAGEGQIHQGPGLDKLSQADYLIDGILGAGLNKPLEGELADLVNAINAKQKPVLAIDVPTGVHGDSGQIMGTAIQAQATVTFFRAKPGHYLHPGKALCGTTSVHQIGIPERAIKAIKPTIWLNSPDLWQSSLQKTKQTAHKYNKGAVLVATNGETMPGATTLAANAALRAGAGLVTVAQSNTKSLSTNFLSAIMITQSPENDEWQPLLNARKIKSVLAGPGMPANEQTKQMVLVLLNQPCSMCLDAGALSSFQGAKDDLINAINTYKDRKVILTPHEGEFTRLFGNFETTGKLQAALDAAKETKATIILKGPDTVIASPDGRAIINTNAPPSLATAGTGDVLAGVTTAYLAKDIPAFYAAAAAVYKHTFAANAIKTGLTADDLVEQIIS